MFYGSTTHRKLWYSTVFIALSGGNLTAHASSPVAVDPGIRSGSVGTGKSVDGLTAAEQNLFGFVTGEFTQVHSVTGNLSGEAGNGLGPGFNSNSCGACHSFPAIGGSSPPVNPQLAMATLDGATNTVPSFIHFSGPIRIARFIYNTDGSRDGSVHNVFTIEGRTDAPGCSAPQPDFETAVAQHNISFRIPSPLFGLGLIDNIGDNALLANKAAFAATKQALGISGHENRDPTDSTLTKFGWKAQDKSLLFFSGDAYNVEMGVTNELFPNERHIHPGCHFNTQPEDATVLDQNPESGGATSGLQHFATFMRLLAPPAAAPATPSTQRGNTAFAAIGCALCHTSSLPTAMSSLPALSNQQAQLFSDLLLHRMGSGLADGIQQGSAGGDEFRTAPLWGLGQRVFLLHDGRTSDLLAAIQAHKSPGSEASAVVKNFRALTPPQQQDVLNFLRSL